ncbi:uncharacterized protein TNCT_718781 [Trichonephila clavata]|uniref:Uncharacterized protein n=1 Tax=Trichonephila clavata TaxID=2740835 RepID=A0A8X6K7G9_TRICU|nr:uncharacterized protein TNCT_718781 [Trichonephila clavata]
MTQTVSKFRKKLNSTSKNGFVSFVSCYNTHASEIFSCISELEQSLSFVLTVLQAYLVWNIFNISTLMIKLKISQIDFIPLVTEIISLNVAVFTFLLLNLSAASVHDAAVAVRKVVFQTVASMESSDENEGSLMLKVASDFPSKCVVTGWKLFQCKRGIVLKIAGAVFTYGIIVTQIGPG